MGFERNHQVKIPSKQLNNILFYSTQVQQPQIDLNKQNIEPWFMTGFTDAEGCFSIKIQPNAKLKTKWRVRPVFSITLHIKDAFLLEAIKHTLGVGNISKSSKTVIFAVDSIKEIPVILNHFDNYPLLTQKLTDYLIFKKCFEIIKRNDHLSEKGLLELISLKSSLNLGLPANLKLAFPNVIAKDRPQYKFKGITNPFWISCFVSGEGSFHIVVRKPENKSISGEVFARFSIHLHVRDIAVLESLTSYFKLTVQQSPDSVVTDKKVTILKNSASLQVKKLYDNLNIIIPFFDKYSILGMKSMDF